MVPQAFAPGVYPYANEADLIDVFRGNFDINGIEELQHGGTKYDAQ